MGKIERIEDIYPLTIISMRYSGKFIILNTIADNPRVSELQECEEPWHILDEYMKKHFSPFPYGIGEDIWSAFEDFKKRHYGY
jgi:hypothetical protein